MGHWYKNLQVKVDNFYILIHFRIKCLGECLCNSHSHKIEVNDLSSPLWVPKFGAQPKYQVLVLWKSGMSEDSSISLFQSPLLPFDLSALWTTLSWTTNCMWSWAFEGLHSFDLLLLLTSDFLIYLLFNPASTLKLNFELALWVWFSGQLLLMNQSDSLRDVQYWLTI